MNRMSLAFVACAALALSGCGTLSSLLPAAPAAPSVPVASNPPAAMAAPKLNPAQAIVFQARAAYDAAFLVPAANYNGLPRCATGTSITVTNLCSDAAIVAKLRKADAAAKAAFDAAETIAAKSPLADPATLLSDVDAAVIAAESIITTYNIQ